MPSSQDDGLTLRKVSEHGLGHLLSPYGPTDSPSGPARIRRWIAEGWRWILDQDLPAPVVVLSSRYLSHVHHIAADPPRFHWLQRSRRPSSQIRPFNFCLSAHMAEFGHPEGTDPTRFHLIAPYDDNPTRYLELPWIDRFSGNAYAVALDEDVMDLRVAIVRSYGAVFASFLRHAESKSLDSDGRAGVGEGWLERRSIREGTRAYTGKESNEIKEVAAGLWGRLDDVLTEYGQAHNAWHQWIVPVLKRIPLSTLISETNLDRRTLQRLRNRHSAPRATTARVLAAGNWARTRLITAGIVPPSDARLACRLWLEQQL